MMSITIKDVQTYIEDNSISNDKLQAIVDGIVSFVENLTGLSFSSQTVTDEKYNGAGQKTLFLTKSGVTEIINFSYNSGTLGTPVRTSFDSDSYILDNDTIVLPYGSLPRGIKNIKVTYKYGYSTIPSDLKLALLKLCAKAINKSNTEGISSESVQGTSLQYSKDELVDSEIESILGRYKKYYV